MGCWADGAGRKNEGHERRNLFGFAPSARPGRRTLRAGVWFREWQVWLPALGSAPPPLGAPPPAERPTLASMLLQCQPCLTPEPFRMQGKLRHGGMPPHAREGCQWAGPGHPGNLLRQGGPGLALCPARAATMGRNRPRWKALRGGGCPCFTERTQGTSPLRV